jgi:hypothetical protein
MNTETIAWTPEKIAATRLVLDRRAVRENLDRRGHRHREFLLIRIFPERDEKFDREDAGTVLDVLNEHARKDTDFPAPDLVLVSGGRICVAWLSNEEAPASVVEDKERSLRQIVERVLRSQYARAVN